MQRYQMMMSDSALWTGFPFRAGDVVISPPAKCGTSWMQLLCALLVFNSTRFPRRLTEISPWLDNITYDFAETLAALEAQQHRRFIKTHTPLDGLPFVDGVTYLCAGRDPRDVGISFDHALANISDETRATLTVKKSIDRSAMPPPPEDLRDRFWLWAEREFVNGPTGVGSLANMIQHLQTFWDRRNEPQVVLCHYHDLLTDLPGQLKRLAEALDIDLPAGRIEELAAAATFDKARERADELAPGVDSGLWRDNRAFFHTGTSGQWKTILSPDDQARFRNRLAELASDDLIEWLYTGWLHQSAAR
ncbi:sulfotransferase domain-containing protein [Catelliglobosispora koreensis]|uniref:sulfotransferase domain-containing protein n=1 Tax=Catelliglobosispora koreensis TaxID=129052 RepID=UPI00039FB00C|nr:sulfotransferase domain-containing protein [Catelliglobosispora koreensis]